MTAAERARDSSRAAIWLRHDAVAIDFPLVSGTVYPMPKIDLSDRDYFRAHKDNPNAGTYVSEVLKARAADTTFFTLSRRIRGQNGGFGGVTTISIAPEYFTNFYAKLPPPGVFASYR